MNDKPDRLNVTKTFLPPLEEYTAYVEQIWSSGQLTNEGPLVKELQKKLSAQLETPNLQLVSNGTIALQLALRTLGIQEGEIITTPFSYVATTSAILWEKFTPVYVDIEPDSLCIDASKIEAAITENTRAILAVHVFGNPCDVEAIEHIAQKHDLKVIYDAAHAFGVKYKEKSLFEYGDISTCSFHATKLFHTIEGGAVVSRDKETNEKIELMKRFGHDGYEHYMLGINGKVSELHAAMGLVNLNHIDEIIERRKEKFDLYMELLQDNQHFTIPEFRSGTERNYAYFPVVFHDQAAMREALRRLNQQEVYPRRYFYPSLNTLPYLKTQTDCPVSEDIAGRILCLPFYGDIDDQDIIRICKELA